MENSMTIEEALRATLNILEGIPVRVSDFQTIGQPVAMAAGNLRVILQAIREQETDKKEKQEAEGNVPD